MENMSEDLVLRWSCYFWKLVLRCTTVIFFQYFFSNNFRSPNCGGFFTLYSLLQAISIVHLFIIQPCTQISVILWETAPPAPFFIRMLGQTHVNGWSRVIVSQNGGSTSYIFPLRLGVLQWSRHLFNYWKNEKTII